MSWRFLCCDLIAAGRTVSAALTALNCMVPALRALRLVSINSAPCLNRRRSSTSVQASVSLVASSLKGTTILAKASPALFASLLVLVNLQLADPACARSDSADYISVQDRTRQRSPLSYKSQDKDLYISEQTSAVSISQQVSQGTEYGCGACHKLCSYFNSFCTGRRGEKAIS